MRARWLLAILAGCALTSKAKPLDVHYFAPVPTHTAQPASRAEGGRIRLGRVTASSYLRYRIAQRWTPVEVSLSDSLRWTEQPEDYARRALARALFTSRGVEQAVTGDALTLTVEVTQFEDVVRGGRHFGCVQLHYQLDDDRDVLASDVVTVERPAASGDMAQVVPAIADALEAATSQVADRVVTRMAKR